MKKILLTMLGVLLVLPAIARDFTYEYEGQTVNYTVLDEDAKTVAVADRFHQVSGELTIPSNPKEGDVEYTLTAIGNDAFSYCGRLTSVEIPNSVTSIGDRAFKDCLNLTSVTIPNSVTSIGDGAFFGCRSLTSVTIPNSVTSIGNNVFGGCSRLASVTIPNSVTSIGDLAFNGCGMKSVEIPNSVTSIGNSAFICSGLKSVEIPYSVTSIGDKAFSDCNGLISIGVHIANPNYSSSDGVLFNKDITELIQCPAGKRGNYAIPIYVTSIGNGAFYGCFSLESVEIPNSVTSIGNHAFYNCSSLTSLTIPNSVTSIGYSAFKGCSRLKSVTIPNSVTSIGEYAFSDCSSLTSIGIPNSVTSIGYSAFYKCSSLTSIVVDSANPNYSSSDGVLFNKDITELIQCPARKSGNYAIPTSVTSIGDYAFYNCWSLTSVDIPNSVTSIGNYAFYNCSSLTSVYYNTTAPVKAIKSIFSDMTYSAATLYVPESAVRTFRQTEPWKNFPNIQGYDFSSGVEDVSAGIDETHPCEYFNLSGVKAGTTKENLAPGIYIMRQGNASKKIVVK